MADVILKIRIKEMWFFFKLELSNKMLAVTIKTQLKYSTGNRFRWQVSECGHCQEYAREKYFFLFFF